MRSGADRCEVRFRPHPTGKCVSDGVFLYIKPGISAQAFYERARARRSDSLKTTRVTTGGSTAEIWCKCVEFGDEAVDSETRRASPWSCSERVASPVFVNEIFRRLLSNRTEPLRTIRRHPDEVAGFDGTLTNRRACRDAPAFEHQQAVFHNVNFDHTETGAGIVGHGVNREVILVSIGQ